MFQVYIAHMMKTHIIKVGTSEDVDKRMCSLRNTFGHSFWPLVQIEVPNASYNEHTMHKATAVETLVRRKFKEYKGPLIPPNKREFFRLDQTIEICDYIREILAKNLHLRRDYLGRLMSI